MRKWISRFLISILFCTALLTTYQGISGVDAKTLVSYISSIENRKTDEKNSNNILSPFGTVLNLFQKITNVDPKKSLSQTVSGKPLTLEESIDWSQYPTEKVIATGYTAGYESTGKKPGDPQFGITYSGVKVTRDLYSTVAADLNVFPIGTILFIPGYGYGVVADKGSAIIGNKVDLYYETVEDVYEKWGKKTLEVFVVKKGNGTLTEEELEALNENESMQVFRNQYIQSEKE